MDVIRAVASKKLLVRLVGVTCPRPQPHPIILIIIIHHVIVAEEAATAAAVLWLGRDCRSDAAAIYALKLMMNQAVTAFSNF